MYLHSFFKDNKYKPVIVSFLIFSGIFLFSLVFHKEKHLFLYFIWAFLFALISFRIFLTGKITLYRKTIFILIALLFIVEFKFIIKSLYYAGPACPVALSGTFLTTFRDLFSNVRNFSLFIPAVLWLCLVFFIGRIWCSWICWFGGIDECFSSIAAKPKIRINNFQDLFSELPSAVLLFSMLITLSSGVAVFCMWICPLKITPSFLNQSSLRFFQVPAFITVGVVFLIVLPLLTNKRIFCRFICPLRGLIRWMSPSHPLKISVNMTKCDRCNKCIDKCNSSAIEKVVDSSQLTVDRNNPPVSPFEKGGINLSVSPFDKGGLEGDFTIYKISPYCNFCLECFEVCPQNAIEINPPTQVLIFIALLLSGIVSSMIFF